jgi:hypothetical protein
MPQRYFGGQYCPYEPGIHGCWVKQRIIIANLFYSTKCLWALFLCFLGKLWVKQTETWLNIFQLAWL